MVFFIQYVLFYDVVWFIEWNGIDEVEIIIVFDQCQIYVGCFWIRNDVFNFGDSKIVVGCCDFLRFVVDDLVIYICLDMIEILVWELVLFSWVIVVNRI